MALQSPKEVTVAQHELFALSLQEWLRVREKVKKKERGRKKRRAKRERLKRKREKEREGDEEAIAPAVVKENVQNERMREFKVEVGSTETARVSREMERI